MDLLGAISEIKNSTYKLLYIWIIVLPSELA